MSHAIQGHPIQMGHSGDFLQNMVTGGGNVKPCQYSCHKNSMNSMKIQEDMTLEDETPDEAEIYYRGRK